MARDVWKCVSIASACISVYSHLQSLSHSLKPYGHHYQDPPYRCRAPLADYTEPTRPVSCTQAEPPHFRIDYIINAYRRLPQFTSAQPGRRSTPRNIDGRWFRDVRRSVMRQGRAAGRAGKAREGMGRGEYQLHLLFSISKR